jgi:hypothetical protein
MAVVEEISLEEAMQSHPSMAQAEAQTSPPKAHPERHNAASEEALFPPCVVEEEITPGDVTGTKTDTATTSGTPQRRRREGLQHKDSGRQ